MEEIEWMSIIIIIILITEYIANQYIENNNDKIK